jgi:hypothetical protein
MEHVRIDELRHEYEQLGRNGFRVLRLHRETWSRRTRATGEATRRI